MRPRSHLALSTAAGGGLWAATGEPWALPVTVAAGVLVDVDHAPDLWWTLALGRKPVATFLLHGWEWVVGLVALGMWTGFPWWHLAVVVGYSLHVTTDHLANRGGMWSYSLIYRARHGFQVAKLAPHWDFDHAYDMLRREVPPAAMLIKWWKDRAFTRSRIKP